MKRILAILALATVPLLAGCSWGDASQAASPPAPKKIFLVKVMTASGAVVETHRATTWSYGSAGCITYVSPADPSNYLTVCNPYGIISVTPEE